MAHLLCLILVSGTRAEACLDCPTGRYSALDGASSCSDCPAGSMAAAPRSVSAVNMKQLGSQGRGSVGTQRGVFVLVLARRRSWALKQKRNASCARVLSPQKR